jgi:2-(1,2-epoxy-1,2-dihydrophenyl)acetyl-CoA isomerase
MTQLIESREQEGVLILTLNAPEQRNALSLEMRRELRDLLAEAAVSKACRAVVLTGAGGNFSSGGQVRSANGDGAASNAERTRSGMMILHDIVRCLAAGAKPTVAAVEGFAYGAGMSLATACDYVAVSDSARFCASFAKIGLMADAGLMWSLPQRVGPARARELMLSGRVVGAPEAQAIGLANQRVAPGESCSAAVDAALSMASLAPLALKSMKETLALGNCSLDEILAREIDVQPRLAGSVDYAEGRAAFHERRPPVFRGE